MAIGVTWLIMVFIAKDIMVASETPRDLVAVLNTSEGMIHETGPQVALKEKLKIQVVAMKPICALMGLESLVGGEGGEKSSPDDELVCRYTKVSCRYNIYKTQLTNMRICLTHRRAVPQIPEYQRPISRIHRTCPASATIESHAWYSSAFSVLTPICAKIAGL